MGDIAEKLDEIINLLKVIAKPPSLVRKVIDWFLIAVTILSILSVIDIIRQWLGG